MILAWEVKNYAKNKVEVSEVKKFSEKLKVLREFRKDRKILGIFYSATGFTTQAIEYLTQEKIAYTDYELFWGEPLPMAEFV